MPTPSLPSRAEFLLATLAMVALGLANAELAVADGSRLYAPCAVCHQPNAWGSPDGTIPNLAGQQRGYLERQMNLFRTGARLDTAMQVVAGHPKFDSSQTVAALATYLSNLDANPKPQEGSGEHLSTGLELFKHICAACHGAAGLGDAVNRVPRISGQHYPYLRSQINAAAEVHKDLAPPAMTSALRGMPAQDKDALADYVSRLGASAVLPDSNYEAIGGR